MEDDGFSTRLDVPSRDDQRAELERHFFGITIPEELRGLVYEHLAPGVRRQLAAAEAILDFMPGLSARDALRTAHRAEERRRNRAA